MGVTLPICFAENFLQVVKGVANTRDRVYTVEPLIGDPLI